jgi:hypothetical protein
MQRRSHGLWFVISDLLGSEIHRGMRTVIVVDGEPTAVLLATLATALQSRICGQWCRVVSCSLHRRNENWQ